MLAAVRASTVWIVATSTAMRICAASQVVRR